MKYYIDYSGGSKIVSYMEQSNFTEEERKKEFTSRIVGMYYDEEEKIYVNKEYDMIDFLNLYLGFENGKEVDLTDSKIFENIAFNLDKVLDDEDDNMTDYVTSLYEAIVNNQKEFFNSVDKKDFPLEWTDQIDFIKKFNDLILENNKKIEGMFSNLEKFNRTLTKPMFFFGVKSYNSDDDSYSPVYFTTPGYLVNIIDTKTLDFHNYNKKIKLYQFKDRTGFYMEITE